MLTSGGRRWHQLGVNGDKYVSEQADRLTAALTSLDQFFHRSGAPIAGALRAGLSDAELDRYETSLGFALPEDVRIWFAWHDGAETVADVVTGCSYLPTLHGLLPLDRAMMFRSRYIEAQVVLPHLDIHTYDPNWLPITATAGGELTLAADCGGLAPAAVHSINVRGDDDWRTPAAASLTDLAELWVTVASGGYWRWDVSETDWADTYGEIPLEWRRTGLLC